MIRYSYLYWEYSIKFNIFSWVIVFLRFSTSFLHINMSQEHFLLFLFIFWNIFRFFPLTCVWYSTTRSCIKSFKFFLNSLVLAQYSTSVSPSRLHVVPIDSYSVVYEYFHLNDFAMGISPSLFRIGSPEFSKCQHSNDSEQIGGVIPINLGPFLSI